MQEGMAKRETGKQRIARKPAENDVAQFWLYDRHNLKGDGMAKLAKYQMTRLRCIQNNLDRGMSVLTSEKYAVARKGLPATTTQHYVNAAGETLYPIEKECGSDLTGFYQAVRQLREFLDAETFATEQAKL